MGEVVDLEALKTPVPSVDGKDVAKKKEIDPAELLSSLRGENAERLTRLARFNIAPNPVLELKVRLDTLTDTLMNEEGDKRSAFECLYETNYASLLDSIIEELGSPRLSTP